MDENWHSLGNASASSGVSTTFHFRFISSNGTVGQMGKTDNAA